MVTSHAQQPMPVAQYLRMSTEHQRYSTTNQREAIAAYAAKHGMVVVETYEDSGKSGLNLKKREALQRLLTDVLSPTKAFRAVVVLDVSRWGRFQDVDESAHYEFLCRRAGVEVVYCAEPFSDVAGPMGVIIKSVKRAMAAEFSRELSTKVFASQAMLARKGYHIGGPAAFGLKRVQVSEDGTVVRDLPPHEYKSRKEDHIELALGDPFEYALVRLIFHWFVHDGMSVSEIVLRLNWNCYPGRRGLTPWRSQYILQILGNEAYIGTESFGKHTQNLRTRLRKTPREQWIVVPHCFEAIVSRADFDEAQRLRRTRRRPKWPDEALLGCLRQVHARFGYVTSKLLFENTDAPGTSPYQTRFGSIAEACRLAGVSTTRHLEATGLRSRQRFAHRLRLMRWLDDRYERLGVRFFWHPRNSRGCVEGALTFSVRVAHPDTHRTVYWQLTPDRQIQPDVCVYVRLAEGGETVLDYFVLPSHQSKRFFISSKGKPTDTQIERYRCNSRREVFQHLETARRTGQMRLPTMLRKLRRGTSQYPRRNAASRAGQIPLDTPTTLRPV